jgi:hypothetical protein
MFTVGVGAVLIWAVVFVAQSPSAQVHACTGLVTHRWRRA